MNKRDIRAQRRAEQKRDHSWMDERDQDQQRDELPEDEYAGSDEFARLAQEFRG